MEADECIDISGSPEQTAYMSVIAAEEGENLEDAEVGDKISTCVTILSFSEWLETFDV